MKIQLGDGKVYTVEADVLDYFVLRYCAHMLDGYEKMDSTLAFGMKFVTKEVLKQLFKAFGVSSSLPRGTDPTIFLLRAYTLMLRETLDHTVLTLSADEEAATLYDATLEYEGLEQIPEKMAYLLERLKWYDGPPALRAADLPAAEHPDRARAVVATSGQEALRQDDGGQGDTEASLRPVS